MPAADDMPNLFIVGVARGGTTSLSHYLGQHPDIFMSDVKEPYYFSTYYKSLGVGQGFPKDPDAYRRLFAAGREARWRGEASTVYFWDPTSPLRIKDAIPEARIIISLRNPADRAYSEYLQALRRGRERRSFLSAIKDQLAIRGRTGQEFEEDRRRDYLSAGLYVGALYRYLHLFEHSVHVLFFEDLRRDARMEVKKIFAFLGVDKSPADDLDVVPLNRSRAPRRGTRWLVTSRALQAMPGGFQAAARRISFRDSPSTVPREARVLLDEFFAAERQPLTELLRRPPPW
jgi:hypothetical protein